MLNDEIKAKYQNSIKDGALRELRAALLFIERGYTVSVPNMSTRYDFIAEKFPIIIRVQVKPLKPIKSKAKNQPHDIEWFIPAYSTVSKKKRPYSIEDCNIVVGIDNEYGNYAVVPIGEITETSAVYRVTDYKGRKRKKYLNPSNFDDICGQYKYMK